MTLRSLEPEEPPSDASPDLAGRSLRRRRTSAVAELQTAIFLRLILGALFFFGIALAAAAFYIMPLGPRSVRAVVPVLDGFMQAGESGDITVASALFSSDAMRAGARSRVAALMADRRLFDGYAGLKVESFTVSPTEDLNGWTPATARATLRYESGAFGTLSAALILEEDKWRLTAVEIQR